MNSPYSVYQPLLLHNTAGTVAKDKLKVKGKKTLPAQPWLEKKAFLGSNRAVFYLTPESGTRRNRYSLPHLCDRRAGNRNQISRVDLWRRLLARVPWILLDAWPAAVGAMHRLPVSEDSESDGQSVLSIWTAVSK